MGKKAVQRREKVFRGTWILVLVLLQGEQDFGLGMVCISWELLVLAW